MKFQIVICGWKCVKETIDHILQVDGKGDEVWGAVRFQEPSDANSTVVRTKTMGDVNNKPGRVQAGSRSSKGGIKTGDQFPATRSAIPTPLVDGRMTLAPTCPLLFGRANWLMASRV